MRTFHPKYIGGHSVLEDTYKVDLAVLDRYQAFSAEIMRLSLLGVAGYGFLLANVAFKASSAGGFPFLDTFKENSFILWAGLLLLVISACAALAHRYFSTDCMTHFIRRLRVMNALASESSEKSLELMQIVRQEEQSLERDINLCRWSLILSTMTLALGLVATGVSFGLTLKA